MVTFKEGDDVEVQVNVNGQMVWAMGKVERDFGNEFVIRWKWITPDGPMSDVDLYEVERIRVPSAEKLAQLEAERKAKADLRASLKEGSEVEVYITLNNQKVWATGTINSIEDETYMVNWHYDIWRSTSPYPIQYPDIRQPSGLRVNQVEAPTSDAASPSEVTESVTEPDSGVESKPASASETNFKAEDEVEVLVMYDGKDTWLPATFVEATNGLFRIKLEDGYSFHVTADKIRPVVAPAGPDFTSLSPEVERASLQGDTVHKYRYSVNGRPFDTLKDFKGGPDSHANVYGCNRQFFLSQLPGNQIGIIWQDKDTAVINLTRIAANLEAVETIELLKDQHEDLVAATQDPEGNSYFLTIQPGTAKPDQPLSAILYKAGPTGDLLGQNPLDTSAQGLDVLQFRDENEKIGINVASMRYSNGQLGVILSRKMYVEHYSAIALVFDANSLAQVSKKRQTSSHSWGNFLSVDSKGNFVGVDLGDNYPRGINLHKFNADGLTSRVVYTYKTRHGEKSLNDSNQGKRSDNTPFEVYTEISNDNKTYYRWSNDNYTYSELGGVIESSDGYTVIFVGEPYQGKALLNERTGGYLNDARNLGLVLVNPEFPPAENGKSCVVTAEVVLTSGEPENAKFYGFRGEETYQQNIGVVWLTGYKDKEQANASRLKVAKLSDGNILVVWEVWTPDKYVNTFAMKIGQRGEKLGELIELGPFVRLNRQDDLLVDGNTIYTVAGVSKEKKLELNVIQLS